MQNKESIVQMFEMRLDGFSLEEIGQHFGITRQRVQQILGDKPVKYGRPVSKCVFPGIVKFLCKHNLSVRQFGTNLGYSGNSLTIYHKLWGINKFTMPEIKKILAYTGMTFEEAFGEEKNHTEEK